MSATHSQGFLGLCLLPVLCMVLLAPTPAVVVVYRGMH